MFLQQQISILEWFLKDCVTLKTDTENDILKYIQIENCYLNGLFLLFFYYYYFLVILSPSYSEILHLCME